MQRLGGFIDLVPVDSVARPSRYFREFVVRIPPSLAELPLPEKTPLLLGLYEFLLRAHFRKQGL